MVNREVLSRERLGEALALQQAEGGQLGQILLARGWVKSRPLCQALADSLSLQFVDLTRQPCDPALLHLEHLDSYLKAQTVPWRRRDGTLAFATADIAAATTLASELAPDSEVRFVLATPSDIRYALVAAFGTRLSDKSRQQLAEAKPHYSARRRLTFEQWFYFLAAVGLLIVGAGAYPAATLVVLNLVLGAFFSGIVALRLISLPVGLLFDPARRYRRQRRHLDLPDRDLPVYTVIVPLFREAKVLPILATALARLDYPPDKLDIKLIFEEDDADTIAAAKELDLPQTIEFILVPKSDPRTKPKACNYALPFARGEFLVIFDAEDQPEPDQLKKAVAAFRSGSSSLACVQARLSYFNAHENWLTRQFTIEYSTWFDLLLPTLDAFGLPIPLGGTSIHFRTELLRELGAWDAHNVTEDADLGIRLAREGYRCGVIDSTTYEEANCRLRNWIRQRSRWIKGYIQTYFVHMRDPRRLRQELGWPGFMGFQAIIGGAIVSALAHPVFWLIYLGALLNGAPALDPDMPQFLLLFNISLLVSGYGVSILSGIIACTKRGNWRLIPSTILMLVYWVFVAIAGYKAVWQFFIRPFYWEKTHHGISRFVPAELDKASRFLGKAGTGPNGD